MKMKKIYLSILMLMFAAILVACQDNDGPNNGKEYDFSTIYKEKEVITVWMDDTDGEYMKAVIEAFNATPEGKDIVVQFQHMGTVDARERLKTFGLTGNGADIFQFPHDHLAPAILEDLVYALPVDFANRMKDRIHPLGLDIATLLYDEKTGKFGPGTDAVERLYALPISLETVGLYYNKKLVSEPATSYEQLIEEATAWNAIKDSSDRTNAEQGLYYLGTSSHWADSYFIQHIYSAFGFFPFGPNLDDASAVGFVNAKEALTWMRDELKPVTTGNSEHNSIGANANFVAGKIPYIIAGPWNIQEYQSATNVDLGIAPLPTIDGKETKPFAGAQMVAIYKHSTKKEAATKFLEFLASDTAMEIMLRDKYKLPALKEELLQNIPGFSSDPYMPAISKQLKNAIPMPTIPEVQYYWGPGESMIQKVWNGTESSIDKAVEDAEQAYIAQRGLGNS